MVRDWAIAYGRVWVVCGPYVYANTYGTIGSQEVVIPDGFFKAILRYDGNEYYSVAFVFDNNSERQPVRDAIVSVNDIESLIGFDLFTNINDKVEEIVESQANWDDWWK